ncbi:SPX domain-containing protein 4-like [Bidens hawaiensis]|uniref:SPX domain-containing protein 4-like n=1 Tax=Bidens hawaiensis TaxID=980011 RepID=UPI00404B7C52
MKFGKEFGIHLEQTLPEWKDKYLCYKLLKNLPNPPPPDHHLVPDLQHWFVRILNEELDKFNDFYVDKEEEFVIRFQELKQRIEQVKEKSSKDGVFTSEIEFSDEMMAIRRDFVTIHGEMVLLKNYSSLNFAGIIKILKKYDKRTGGLLRVHFTQLALRQPFFTTEPLTRLVHECEENLDLLFPLEAEVVESFSSSKTNADENAGASDDNKNSAPALVGEGGSDVYRRTVDAIRTIKGLKKESSTANPLSFASIFGNQDMDDTGAITDPQSEPDCDDDHPPK